MVGQIMPLLLIDVEWKIFYLICNCYNLIKCFVNIQNYIDPFGFDIKS